MMANDRSLGGVGIRSSDGVNKPPSSRTLNGNRRYLPNPSVRRVKRWHRSYILDESYADDALVLHPITAISRRKSTSMLSHPSREAS